MCFGVITLNIDYRHKFLNLLNISIFFKQFSEIHPHLNFDMSVLIVVLVRAYLDTDAIRLVIDEFVVSTTVFLDAEKTSR